jgi:hypothetical protein
MRGGGDRAMGRSSGLGGVRAGYGDPDPWTGAPRPSWALLAALEEGAKGRAGGEKKARPSPCRGGASLLTWAGDLHMPGGHFFPSSACALSGSCVRGGARRGGR